MLARLRHYHFDWKLTLFTALLFPVLVSLGFWQLEREAEKQALQQMYASRQSEAPTELTQLDTAQDLQYRQVLLGGSWDNAHVFLLDNRIYQGQVGFEVLVPMHTPDGTVVFINRGWIPQGAYRDQLPAVELIEGDSLVHGSIYVPVGEQFVLGAEQTEGAWPRVIQAPVPATLATLAGYGADTRIFPYTVRLGEGAPGALTRYWPVISTTPEKHRAYAVQWFAMAAVLLGLYLYYSTRPDTDANAAHAGR